VSELNAPWSAATPSDEDGLHLGIGVEIAMCSAARSTRDLSAFPCSFPVLSRVGSRPPLVPEGPVSMVAVPSWKRLRKVRPQAAFVVKGRPFVAEFLGAAYDAFGQFAEVRR